MRNKTAMSSSIVLIFSMLTLFLVGCSSGSSSPDGSSTPDPSGSGDVDNTVDPGNFQTPTLSCDEPTSVCYDIIYVRYPIADIDGKRVAMPAGENPYALKPGGDLLLFGHVWQPTAVMLDKAPYPGLETLEEQAAAAEVVLHYLYPAGVPELDGRLVPANVYVLGAALGLTGLGKVLDPASVEELVISRWKRGVEANRLAFRAGLGN